MARSLSSHASKIFLPCVLLCVCALAAGCGAGTVNTSVPLSTLAIHGHVQGGQNPVAGANVVLFKVGAACRASAAGNILTRLVSTDNGGDFVLTGTYSCGSANEQMYIAATGGNPGLSAGTRNGKLAMVTALGNCGNLSSTTYVVLNELTSAAAAYALAQFAADWAHIGATPGNTLGISNAVLNAQLLVDTTTGKVIAQTAQRTFESAKLTSLANTVATCVNSDGTTGCNALMSAATPAGGTAPADTFTALLNIVKNPGQNVQAVYNVAGPQRPFTGGLTTAPNDWTMSMTVTGGGLAAPTALALDASGNVFVADFNGGLSAFSPQGAALVANGVSTGPFNEIYGIAVDPSGYVWMVSEEFQSHGNTKGSVIKLQGGSNPGAVIGFYYDASIDYPESIFADSNGNIDIGNYANGTATIYSPTGAVVASGLGAGSTAFPVSIMADANHGVWMANESSNTVTHVSSSGTLLANPACCERGTGVALDSDGTAWVSNYTSSSVSAITNSGTVALNQSTGGGITNPSGLMVDSAQNIWLVNFIGNSLSEVAGYHSTSTAGTALTPSTGLGLDASLKEPYALAPDASGNIWIANYANNDLVVFLGLAAPTKTPLSSSPSAP